MNIKVTTGRTANQCKEISIDGTDLLASCQRIGFNVCSGQLTSVNLELIAGEVTWEHEGAVSEAIVTTLKGTRFRISVQGESLAIEELQ